MNANQVQEMKAQIREMQTLLDSVSNDAAGEMLSIMRDTGKAYTGAELSQLTENILTPSQAASAVRAVIALNPEYQNDDYRERGRRRRPTTKYTIAKDFINMNVRLEKDTRKTFSIACDEEGRPLNNAKPKVAQRLVTTYKLEESRGW